MSTLTRITSKISKVDKGKFLGLIFDHLFENQKLCVLFHDEIYIEKMLLYHGGTIFGRSADNPSALAKTILGIIIFCLNGGPKFLSRLVPVSRLRADFLFDQIKLTTQSVDAAGATVKAIVYDRNCVNQAFFQKFDIVHGKPGLTLDGKYLLFDFVHLLKNIRNLWLTEKLRELMFYDNGVPKIAKWSVLKKLFELERRSLVKLSDLNETSIAPKPIERQKVSTCLRIFSEKTCSALLTHPSLDIAEVEDTAAFLKIVITWWKILNVKAYGADVRHNDPLRAVIENPDDNRLLFLLQLVIWHSRKTSQTIFKRYSHCNTSHMLCYCGPLQALTWHFAQVCSSGTIYLRPS